MNVSRHTDITVVVTNYNYGRYLEEAVRSALNQLGGSPHVVVVDDGSTEPLSAQVLHRLPSEVAVIRQANVGLPGARNAGLAWAHTPYLLVLDADDRLRPAAIDALRRPLDGEPGLGFSYGITHFFGDWEGEMTMPAYDPYKLLYRHTIGSTCLMRRELFEQVGGFDPIFTGYEDWEFWLHALSCGWHGRRVDEVTFDYRRHGKTMMSGARRDYHKWYRRLRVRHAALYERSGELARQSGIGPVEQVIYRWWWGARPIPAGVEHALHRLIWGVGRWRSPRP